LKKTYSLLGYKHFEKTLVKINSNLNRLNLSKSIKVVVTNLEKNISKEYAYLTEAVNSLNTNKTIIKDYKKKKYLIKVYIN